MPERAKTILIGTFIIIASLAILGTLLFLRPTVGDGKKKLFVCFTSIEKLQIGTRVTFAGKPVGEVIAIKEIYDARSQPTGRYGHICFYELELAIDSHTTVYDTDEITVHTTGLMGERTIAIVPKAVPKGTPSYPVTDQVLYGKSGDPVEEVLNQIIQIGTKASAAIDLVQSILVENREPLATAVRNVGDAFGSVKTTFDDANTTHLVTNVSSTFANFSDISAEWKAKGMGATVPEISQNLADITTALNDEPVIKETLQGLHAFATALGNKTADVEAILDNVTHITDNAARFSDSLNPSGTIGRLFSDDTVYLQFVQVMSKANLLMDDVNNYGVLFHLDKCWQRERARRMNLLYKLANARDFSCYFEQEMGQINVSLSRLNRALGKVQSIPCAKQLVRDKEFTCSYTDLMSRIQDIEESLEAWRVQLGENCQPSRSCCK